MSGFVHDESREVYGLLGTDQRILGDLYESAEAAQRAADLLNAANPLAGYRPCLCRLNLNPDV